MRHPLSVILILATATVSFGIDLKEKCNWTSVDIKWKNECQKCGGNDTNACVLYDVDRAPDGRIFVTVVREPGVQATLCTVSNKMGEGGPILLPYPDCERNKYEYNTKPDCDTIIISVYRVSIKCNYIFVLDSGDNWEEKVCPPKLLIFDLKDDKLVKRITIPSNMFNNDSLFVTPLVHVRNCKDITEDLTVFMADITGFGLVIYNLNFGYSRFCRIESKYMKPTNTNFTIENQEFYLDDGILGLATIGKKLYYADLAGNSMYKMNVPINERCSELTENEVNDLTQLAGTLSGQTAAIASAQNAIFFSNIPETSILCQNTCKKFNSTNTELIAQDSEKLQFVSGMKVDRWHDALIMLSNRFQRFNTNTSNSNETNFRILVVDIEQVRKETNCFASCEKHGHGKHGHGKLGYGRFGHGRFEHGRSRHGRPWYRFWNRRSLYDKPWNRRFWERSNEHNENSEYDKDHEHDEDDKDDKHDKDDKDDKHDKKVSKENVS